MRSLGLAFRGNSAARSLRGGSRLRCTGAAGPAAAAAGGTGGGGRQLHAAGAEAVAPEPDRLARRGQVFSMPGNGSAGRRTASTTTAAGTRGKPTAAAPAWVAIKLTAAPTRVLVSWDDGGTYNYKTPTGTTVYGLPADYSLRGVVRFDQRRRRRLDRGRPAGDRQRRAHARARARFHGQVVDQDGDHRRARRTRAAAASPSARSTSTTSRRPATGLPEDTWFFMGDSITAFAYDRRAANQPSFAAADQHRDRARVHAGDDQRRHRRRDDQPTGWRGWTRCWR